MINKKNLAFLGSVTLALVLIPLIAMQFTDEVNWKLGDFMIAGSLLFALGLCLHYALDKFQHSRLRYAVLVLILLAFILIWMELAVGVLEHRWLATRE